MTGKPADAAALGAGASMQARDAHRLTPTRRFHIYLLEARFQFVEVLREPMFAIPTLAFPLIFYLFFGVIMGARGVSLAVPTYVLATYGVFGVLGPALFAFLFGHVLDALALRRGGSGSVRSRDCRRSQRSMSA